MMNCKNLSLNTSEISTLRKGMSELLKMSLDLRVGPLRSLMTKRLVVMANELNAMLKSSPSSPPTIKSNE